MLFFLSIFLTLRFYMGKEKKVKWRAFFFNWEILWWAEPFSVALRRCSSTEVTPSALSSALRFSHHPATHCSLLFSSVLRVLYHHHVVGLCVREVGGQEEEEPPIADRCRHRPRASFFLSSFPPPLGTVFSLPRRCFNQSLNKRRTWRMCVFQVLNIFQHHIVTHCIATPRE